MDIQHYRNFITIAQAGSLSAASKQLRIAQPALSIQLKALEEEYGGQLMKRGPRGIELTDAGRVLCEKARRICDLEDSAKKEVFDCAHGQSKTLRLGLTPSTASAFFNNLLAQFQCSNPNTRYELYEADSCQVIDLLRSGVIDVGIVRTPFAPHEKFRCRFAPLEPMDAAFVPERFPGLAQKGILKLNDLAHTPFCVVRRYTELLTSACCAAGFSPDLAFVPRQISSSLSAAAAGLGVAVLPRSAIGDGTANSHLCFCEIESEMLYTRRAVLTVYGRGAPEIAERFALHCENLFYLSIDI